MKKIGFALKVACMPLLISRAWAGRTSFVAALTSSAHKQSLLWPLHATPTNHQIDAWRERCLTSAGKFEALWWRPPLNAQRPQISWILTTATSCLPTQKRSLTIYQRKQKTSTTREITVETAKHFQVQLRRVRERSNLADRFEANRRNKSWSRRGFTMVTWQVFSKMLITRRAWNWTSRSGDDIARPMAWVLSSWADGRLAQDGSVAGEIWINQALLLSFDWYYRTRIRWAPLNVPLKRRLQTLVVLCHTLSIALGLTFFFFLCAIPLTWPILFPYVLYLLFSNAGTSGSLKRRSNWLRSLRVWSLFGSYFPARLHRSQELPATRKYIFGYHPHGIISHGAFAAFATEALGFSTLFPGVTNTLLTLDANFRIPIYRDYALAMGLRSVSRESCINLLTKGGANGEGMGRAITIVVGGARESLDAQPRSLRLVLRQRKGFIKLAIRTGADLVPVLAFGENELYDQVQPDSHPFIHKMQLIVKKIMGFTVPLFFARGVFNYDVGMMPYRQPLNVVVGKPIRSVQTNHPDETYVDEIHEKYVKELTRIWEDWKGEFAGSQVKTELEIID